MRLTIFALAALFLALPATSGAAVKKGVDRHSGMRLTLDGRVLSAKLLNAKAEDEVFGHRIDAICSSRYWFSRRHLVIRKRFWPAGESRLAFVFGRDISRRARWCLIERDARDVAFVSFIRREPVRFVGKGRGPSGDWWRLAGWRGQFAEPCALLRIRGWSTRPCFTELSDRPVRLGVRRLFAPCHRDVLVFGVVGRETVSVRVLAADGSAVEATLFDPAEGSRVRGRYFVAALPAGTEIGAVEWVDAGGNSRTWRGLEGAAPCEG